jgi:choline dehydrogenase-like flavoprotein
MPTPSTVTVLVIEAGPLDQGQDGILVPGAYAPYLYFWPNLVTVPQAGLNNRTIAAITAQVVGGGSTINAMVYLRCESISLLFDGRMLTVSAA